MAYIGPAPNPGQNREVDDISSGFNGGTASFTLQVNGQNVSPGSANAIIVSLGGVVQNPGTDYTVAASTITFTTNPASGLSFFGLVLGQQVDTEGTADGSITLNKFINGTSSNDGKFLRANNGAAPSFETVTGTTINNNADNRIITGSGTANTLNGEATLTYNGTDTFELQPASATPAIFIGDSNRTGAGQGLVQYKGNWNGTTVARITMDAGSDTTNKDDGIIRFDTAAAGSVAEAMRIDSSGRVGIGTTSPNTLLTLDTDQHYVVTDSGRATHGIHLKGQNGNAGEYGGAISFACGDNGSSAIAAVQLASDPDKNGLSFFTHGSTTGADDSGERMRLGSNAASVYIGRVDAEVTVGSSNDSFSEGVGVTLAGGGNQAYSIFAANNTTTMYVARRTTDGTLIAFYHNTGFEGNISISGTTVSYNGGHLSRWSQLVGISETDKSARPEIYQGTVMSNLDELCVWSHPDVLYTEQDKIDGSIPDGKDVGDIKVAAHTEDNQQLNKTKVSDTVGDKDVAGVFWAWDDDDDEYVNDFYIAMTGDMVIRVAASTTVARGDLLISAGDGTAKPQADDIVRSSTIAKIISTNHTATYPDGSKAYPCVLMAC